MILEKHIGTKWIRFINNKHFSGKIFKTTNSSCFLYKKDGKFIRKDTSVRVKIWIDKYYL